MSYTLSDIYPFATQDGKAIPLDILKPSGLILHAYTEGSASTLIIPEQYQVGMFLATTSCLVCFGEELVKPFVDSIIYENTLLVPSGNVVSSAIRHPSLSIIGLNEGGQLYIQLIDRWAGLALDRQYQRK